MKKKFLIILFFALFFYNNAFAADKIQESDYYYAIAEEKTNKNEYNEALIYFNKAIELNPNAYMYMARGNCYFNISNYDNAISDFTKVIENDPTTAGAYASMGHAKKQIKDYSGALQDFKIAAKLYKKQRKINYYDMTLDDIVKTKNLLK